MLQVRVSELKAAIQEKKPLRGEAPPEPIYRTGSGGWVFKVHRILPGNAARIFRKKYSVSRYP